MLDVEHQYVMFNKPTKVMTTMRDPEGRRSIDDFLQAPHRTARLFHVGRLDYEIEGLLLLTNDGELANRLTHPSYEVPKTYLVEATGDMAREPPNAWRPASSSTTGRSPPTTASSSDPPVAARWSRSPCTQAETGSCAGCSTPSDIP